MLTFPPLLRPTAGGYAPNAKTISGGQSFGGFEQVVSSVNDRWQASFRFPLNRRDRILAMRAFLLSMRGRSNTVALPAFDLDRSPYAVAAAAPIGSTYGATFYTDYPELAATIYRYAPIGELSGTATVTSGTSVRLTVSGGAIAEGMVVDCGGSKQKITVLSPAGAGLYDAIVSPGFPLAPGVRTAPVAVLAAAAALNVTALTISETAGIAPVAGTLFSIATRLYSITDISGAGPYACSVWPPLRAAAAVGDAVNFASPVCEMRFASDTEGADALKAMDLLRFGSVTLSFDEVPPTDLPGRELREDGGYELREV